MWLGQDGFLSLGTVVIAQAGSINADGSPFCDADVDGFPRLWCGPLGRALLRRPEYRCSILKAIPDRLAPFEMTSISTQ
jgi:hypothetical protein